MTHFIINLLLFISLNHNSSDPHYIKSSENSRIEDSIFVQKILQASFSSVNQSKKKYLIISKHICSSCVDNALAEIRQSSESQNIGVIVLGEDAYEIRRKNIVYRGKLLFIHCNEQLLRDLEKTNRDLVWQAFIGVRLLANSTYKIVTGGNGNRDLKEKVAIVTKFLITG